MCLFVVGVALAVREALVRQTIVVGADSGGVRRREGRTITHALCNFPGIRSQLTVSVNIGGIGLRAPRQHSAVSSPTRPEPTFGATRAGEEGDQERKARRGRLPPSHGPGAAAGSGTGWPWPGCRRRGRPPPAMAAAPRDGRGGGSRKEDGMGVRLVGGWAGGGDRGRGSGAQGGELVGRSGVGSTGGGGGEG